MGLWKPLSVKSPYKARQEGEAWRRSPEWPYRHKWTSSKAMRRACHAPTRGLSGSWALPFWDSPSVAWISPSRVSWLVSESQEPGCVYLPNTDIKITHYQVLLLCGFWGFTSNPYASVANILPTEPSLIPHLVSFIFHLLILCLSEWCVCKYGHEHAIVRMWRSEDNSHLSVSH